MRRFRGMALSLLLLCGLSGCSEPGTLTLTVSGDYAEDFTAGGGATARLTASAVDAEGKSLPIKGNITWKVKAADIHDKVVAWNRDRHSVSGLHWYSAPSSPQTGGNEDDGSTILLTDIVGSRTVTVVASLQIARPPEEAYKGAIIITAETTFTFGDGPLSLFSAPPRQVASREEAERYCATFRPAAPQGGETTENALPPATLLQLVSDNGINGYGRAKLAGWPGENEERYIYSYWARETKKNGNEGRVVNVKGGLALWYDAKVPGILAVCAPKSLPAPPAPVMSPEKAALRAEAEKILLPQRSDELFPLPDIWKLLAYSVVPAAGDAPLYYGTPPLAEYNNCYAPSVAALALEQSLFSTDEILSFAPSTFPQPLLSDPLTPLDLYLQNHHTSYLIRKAREGDPAAMLAISRRLPQNSPSRFFWWRLADALTRPGWAYGKENGKKTDPSFLGLMGNPRDMLAMEYPFLDDAISEPVAGTPDRRHFYRELMRECALRGQIFAWEICAHMYACNVAGSTIPKGIILDKPNPTWGYALALAGKRLAEDKDAYRAGYSLSSMDRWTVDKRLPQGFPYRWTLYDTWSPTYLEYEFYNEAIGSTESQLKQNAAELGIDLIKGQALATELLAVYRENYQRVLERQRRRRAAMLPEVNRQIDGWLMDMKARNSEWLKKEWPTWPAYGAEWGRRE